MITATPQTSRSIVLAAFGCLVLLASTPTAFAGSAENPEILDKQGDVNPLANVAALTLPVDNPGLKYLELYDIKNGYVAEESLDSFVLRVEVVDIPDLLKLPAGTPTGGALPPGLPVDVQWANDLMTTNVDNITWHFAIKGQSYQAIASLTTLKIVNPNALPQQSSPSSQSASSTSPTSASEGKKTEKDCDASAPAQTVGVPGVGPLATVPGTSVPVSTCESAAADSPESSSTLAAAAPQVQPPQVVLFDRFVLLGPSGVATEISGATDVSKNTVQMVIPKRLVGSPALGDVMSQNWADSALRIPLDLVRMDYAPDALPVSADNLPGPFQAIDDHGQLVTPTFGNDYTFAHATAQRASGDQNLLHPNPVRLEAVGLREQTIQAGGVATYLLTLHNDGTSRISGVYGLSNAASGWSHQIGASSWSLDPGMSSTVILTVTAIGGGDTEQASRLLVIQSGGDTQAMEYKTTLKSSSPEAQVKKKHKTPGVEFVGTLAALAALVALARVRPRK